jgi:hypothetical protein
VVNPDFARQAHRYLAAASNPSQKMRRSKVPAKFTSQEISEKYDQFAPWYDWLEGIPDALGVSRLRRRLIQEASGRILEVAVGTGKTFPTIGQAQW